MPRPPAFVDEGPTRIDVPTEPAVIAADADAWEAPVPQARPGRPRRPEPPREPAASTFDLSPDDVGGADTPEPAVREHAPPAPRAVLEYMSGADRGSNVPIGAALTVGQSKHCGMSIPGDTRLSPVHCKVERTPSGGYRLIDEGSANGTVVNGARISEVDLAGGEVIMVGRTVLRFRWLEEA